MTTDQEVALELGEGFTGEEVVVLVDGKEVWRQYPVRTNYSVGLAEVIRLPASAQPGAVEVRAGTSTATAALTPSGADSARLRADLDADGVLHLGPAGPEEQRF